MDVKKGGRDRVWEATRDSQGIWPSTQYGHAVLEIKKSKKAWNLKPFLLYKLCGSVARFSPKLLSLWSCHWRISAARRAVIPWSTISALFIAWILADTCFHTAQAAWGWVTALKLSLKSEWVLFLCDMYKYVWYRHSRLVDDMCMYSLLLKQSLLDPRQSLFLEAEALSFVEIQKGCLSLHGVWSDRQTCFLWKQVVVSKANMLTRPVQMRGFARQRFEMLDSWFASAIRLFQLKQDLGLDQSVDTLLNYPESVSPWTLTKVFHVSNQIPKKNILIPYIFRMECRVRPWVFPTRIVAGQFLKRLCPHEAAMFFCVAEGHVEDGDLEEASVASEGRELLTIYGFELV